MQEKTPQTYRIVNVERNEAWVPQIQKLLDEQGLIYAPNTTAEFQARITAETARWAQIITANKLEVDQ